MALILQSETQTQHVQAGNALSCKVILVLSSYVSALATGGHTITVATYYEALSQQVNCRVINIGPQKSPVIAGITNHHYQRVRLSSLLSDIRALKTYVMSEAPAVLHSFDKLSLLVCSYLSSQLGIGHVHTKCGGPVPEHYYPECRTITVFAQQDADWFARSSRHSGSKVLLMPNRVFTRPINSARLECFVTRFRASAKRIIVVARFVAYKDAQFSAATKLVSALKEHGLDVQLAFVGVVQDSAYFEDLKSRATHDTLFFTSASDTVQAGELLAAADVAIATGRGTMEAAVAGVPCVLPSNSNECAPLCPDTFTAGLKANFSVRAHYAGWNLAKTTQYVSRLFQQPGQLALHLSSLRGLCQKYFLIDGIVSPLLEEYRTSLPFFPKIEYNLLRLMLSEMRKLA